MIIFLPELPMNSLLMTTSSGRLEGKPPGALLGWWSRLDVEILSEGMRGRCSLGNRLRTSVFAPSRATPRRHHPTSTAGEDDTGFDPATIRRKGKKSVGGRSLDIAVAIVREQKGGMSGTRCNIQVGMTSGTSAASTGPSGASLDCFAAHRPDLDAGRRHQRTGIHSERFQNR